MFNSVEIGNRIRQAREECGLKSPEALAKATQEKLKLLEKLNPGRQKSRMRTLARQTVENWEKGRNIPPWDKVEAMALVFAPLGYGEVWIMFGEKRAEQLARDRSHLERVTDDEAALLQMYRETNDQGKQGIIASTKGISGANPAQPATVHDLHRKGGDLAAN